MSLIQTLFKTGVLRPIKRLGLAIATKWPFPVRTKIEGGRAMYVDLRSSVGRGIFATSRFDPEVFTPIASALKPGDTFLDIGANVGYYSMLAIDLIGPKGCIHAFEIDPRPLKCLRKTIKKTHINNIVIHACAVGEASGTLAFSMGLDCGHSSLSNKPTGMEVPVRTIDQMVSSDDSLSIKAVKIDIEGGELQALRGMSRILREQHPLLVIESDEDLQEAFGYNQADLIAYLESFDYKVSPLLKSHSPTIVAQYYSVGHEAAN